MEKWSHNGKMPVLMKILKRGHMVMALGGVLYKVNYLTRQLGKISSLPVFSVALSKSDIKEFTAYAFF